MTRTWYLSPLRFSSALISFLLFFSTILIPNGNASRGGVEERGNGFAVGFTYSDAGTPSVCSGILIAPRIIATARHCVRNDSGVDGTDYIFSNSGERIDGLGVSAKISKVVITDEDSAFIILNKALSGTKFLKIADATTISTLPDGIVLSGYGYGAVYESGAPYSSFVRKYFLDWSTAGKVPTLNSTYELTNENSTACRGDSGGPIVATLPSGEMVLVAVMSGAANVESACGTQGTDGLFRMRVTLVSPYLSLIPEYSYPVKKKITCVKIVKKKTYTKKVTGYEPKCPKGYKLKK